MPTEIGFSKNPLATLTGQPKELGKLITKHEEVFGVDVKYFENIVTFVQVVELKSAVTRKLGIPTSG